VTIRAAVILGLAVAALVASGWRKTARAQTKLRREANVYEVQGSTPRTPRRLPITVTTAPTQAYHSPGPLRRLWALIAGSGLVVIVGAVVATLVAFGLAFIVTVLTNLLKQ